MKEKKDRRNRFLPQAADRGSAEFGLSLAECPARHLRWSAAISSAFRRGKGLPAWRPASFIFGLRAKRMFSLMRSVLNLQLSWPRLEQNLFLTSKLVTQQLLPNRQESSAVGRHFQKPGRRGASLVFWHSHSGQTVTELAKRSEHGIWPQGPLLPSTLWLTPLAGTLRLGPRENAIPQEASVPEMTTRIMRRLTRVEQASFLLEPRLVSSPAPIRGFEQVVETPARRSYHDASPLRRSEADAGGSTPSGINVTQVTDEVMRQIDRRLVAFRERLGKI